MNRIHKIVWSKIKQKWLVVSERAGAKGAPVLSIGAVSLAVMMLISRSASAADTFLDFSSGLSGWTTYGATATYSSPTTYSVTLGDQIRGFSDYTLAPASGETMVLLTPSGSTPNISTIDGLLHLSNGTVLNTVGSGGSMDTNILTTTNYGVITKSFTLNQGSYSFAWAFAAADYQPYSDGVMFVLSDGNSVQTVKLLARIGSSSVTPPQTGYPSGTIVLNDYGSTQWETYTFDITTAGSYWISFVDFNCMDEYAEYSPLLFIGNTAGTVTSGGGDISGGTPFTTAQVAAGTVSTVFDGGTLKVGASNLTLTKDFTVKLTGGTIDQNGLASTFSGDISNAAVNSPGSLNIVNTGSGGSVTLSGINTYTGTTTVETGATLVVNGLLSSPVIVNTGAALHGLGVINSPITVAGILAPGNSPGTLTTVGTVTMASGSTMSVDVDGLGTGDGAGNYDRLLITGTGNQFVIESGSTLSPVLRGITGSANNTFVPSLGDSFRIVTADGGISGRFDTILQPASGLLDGTRFYAFYNVAGSNSVDLRVIPTSWESYVYLHDGNENAQSAARVLDQLVAADSVSPVSSKQQALLYGAAGANAADLTGMTTALAGEVHGAMAAEVPLSSLALQSMVSDILGESPLCGEDKTTKRGVWFTATKNWDKRYGDDLASSFDADRNQYTVGGDLLLNKNARIGVGYSHVDADVNASHDSSGSATQNMGFVYGQFNLGGAVLESLVSLGSTNWKTSRPDPLGLSPESLDSEENGFDSMAGVTLRVPVTSKGLSVQPYASLVWVHSDRGSIEEDGASPAALSLPGYSMNGTRMMAGVALGSETRNPLAVPSTFHLNLGFGRDSSDLAHPQVDAELADIDMPILTPRVSQTFFQTKAGATMRLMKNGYCYANYAGQFRNGADSHGCEVGVRFEL